MIRRQSFYQRFVFVMLMLTAILFLEAVVGLTPEVLSKSNRMDRGFCTWYAADSFNKVAPEPGANWLGNASEWYAAAKNKGWSATSDVRAPQVGAVVVWGGGLGHVGIVDSVAGYGIVISEMNWGPGRWNKVTKDTLNWAQVSRRNGHPFIGYIFPWKANSAPPAQQTPSVALPVPPAQQAPSTVKPTPTTPAAVPIAASLRARYVSESKPYDNNILAKGLQFTKEWTLKNNGNVTWSAAGYRFRRVGGNFGPTVLNLTGDVKPGVNVTIGGSFTAPDKPGLYRVSYRAEGPNGQFGDVFWVQIIVR